MNAKESRKIADLIKEKNLPEQLGRDLKDAHALIDRAANEGKGMVKIDHLICNEAIKELKKEGYEVWTPGGIGVPYTTNISW